MDSAKHTAVKIIASIVAVESNLLFFINISPDEKLLYLLLSKEVVSYHFFKIIERVTQ